MRRLSVSLEIFSQDYWDITHDHLKGLSGFLRTSFKRT
jgi:hypothetical protein